MWSHEYDSHGCGSHEYGNHGCDRMSTVAMARHGCNNHGMHGWGSHGQA